MQTTYQERDAMQLERRTIELDRGIYGKPQVEAYTAAGLAAHKVLHGKGWRVTHIASGSAVASPRNNWPTKAAAVGQMQALHAMPIDWTKDFESIKRDVGKHSADIRATTFSN